MVNNFKQHSQNFLAVTKARSLKTCLLPIDALVLYQEQNNYETAQGFYFASQYPVKTGYVVRLI